MSGRFEHCKESLQTFAETSASCTRCNWVIIHADCIKLWDADLSHEKKQENRSKDRISDNEADLSLMIQAAELWSIQNTIQNGSLPTGCDQFAYRYMAGCVLGNIFGRFSFFRQHLRVLFWCGEKNIRNLDEI